jgi:hypothetical protein
MAGSVSPSVWLSALRRKLRPCSTADCVEYTSAVLLNTSRPNSPRHR